MIEVTVSIDFGPAGRQPFEAVVTVPEKSTVLDVLLDRLPVTTLSRRSTESKTTLGAIAAGASKSTVLDLTFRLNDIS